MTQPLSEPEIRLIAVDLDGTLLRSDSSLSPEGGRALAAAASHGVKVVLTTTRNLSSVRGFAAEMGIRDPVICTNGAHILASPDGPTWVRRLLPEGFAGALVEQADARGWHLITTVVQGIEVDEVEVPQGITVYRRREGELLGWRRPDRLVVAQNREALDYGSPIRVLNYEADAIREIRATCAASFPGQVHLEIYLNPDASVKSIGIFAAGSDKGKGLGEVMARLGIDAGAVMAIGDNPNDLPMFRVAGLRVAMGNAPDVVRRAASVIAPSNDDAGVAWAVKRFVLGTE